MPNPPLIAPSLLAADFARLAEAATFINDSEADWLHVDVMDGVFVPNISFGFPVMDAIRPLCRKPLDVHLMIQQPERYVERFAQAGAAVITVHYEACPHLHRTLGQIRDAGCRAGVALNPHTPVTLLADVLDQVDLILVMSVNPGFGGQTFIPHTYQKLRQLRAMLAERQRSVLVEVDGGVGPANAGALVAAGADVLVAGASVFGAADPHAAVSQLKHTQPALA